MGVSDAVELTQVVASSAMVLSVVYLAKQRRENHIMMKMQFDFNLTERLDRRYFEASQNVEFTNFYQATGNLTQEGASMDQRDALKMFKEARL